MVHQGALPRATGHESRHVKQFLLIQGPPLNAAVLLHIALLYRCLDVLHHGVWAEVHGVEALDFAVHVLGVVVIQEHLRLRSQDLLLHGLAEPSSHGEVARALAEQDDVEAVQLLSIFGQLFACSCLFQSHAFQTFKKLPALEFMLFVQHARFQHLKNDSQVLLVLLLLALRERLDQLVNLILAQWLGMRCLGQLGHLCIFHTHATAIPLVTSVRRWFAGFLTKLRTCMEH